MSLAPSTDIVMEVARAADPARAAGVVERLNALGRGDAASPRDFAAALNDAAGAPSSVVAAPAPPPSRAKKAETQLESVMLSEFIGEMLPKDTPSAFGQGYAGDMWRSMLAERVADQIAASGRLGIASRLFAGHPLSSSARLFSADRTPSATQTQTVQASANALSSAGGADIQDGAFLFARSTPL
jgi:Rod binding domain-containing protein